MTVVIFLLSTATKHDFCLLTSDWRSVNTQFSDYETERENIALQVHSLYHFTSKNTSHHFYHCCCCHGNGTGCVYVCLCVAVTENWGGHSHLGALAPFCSPNLRVAHCHLCLGGPASCVTHCKRGRRRKKTPLFDLKEAKCERVRQERGERERQESSHRTDRYLDKQRETIIKRL